MTVAETDFTRIPIFITRSTGTIHRIESRPWGEGPACTSEWTVGTATSGLVGDVDCQNCIQYNTPPTWDVVLPDKRYKTGYRVVHEGIADHDLAEEMAAEIPNAYTVDGIPG